MCTHVYIYIYHGIWWYINMSRRPSCLLRGQARILVRPRVRQHLAVHVAGVMVRYEAMETIKWLSQLLDFDEVSIYDYSYISNIWLSNDYQMTYMGLSHISNISHMCPIYVPYISPCFRSFPRPKKGGRSGKTAHHFYRKRTRLPAKLPMAINI